MDPTDPNRRCLVPGCNAERHTGGLCEPHHNNEVRTGHPLDPTSPPQTVTRPLDSVLLPTDPLHRLITAAGGIANVLRQDLDEVTRRRWIRVLTHMLEQGHIDCATADRLAVEGLGRNPARLWGDEWWAADDSWVPPPSNPG